MLWCRHHSLKIIDISLTTWILALVFLHDMMLVARDTTCHAVFNGPQCKLSTSVAYGDISALVIELLGSTQSLSTTILTKENDGRSALVWRNSRLVLWLVQQWQEVLLVLTQWEHGVETRFQSTRGTTGTRNSREVTSLRQVVGWRVTCKGSWDAVHGDPLSPVNLPQANATPDDQKETYRALLWVHRLNQAPWMPHPEMWKGMRSWTETSLFWLSTASERSLYNSADVSSIKFSFNFATYCLRENTRKAWSGRYQGNTSWLQVSLQWRWRQKYQSKQK